MKDQSSLPVKTQRQAITIKPDHEDLLRRIAKDEGIPVTGITILGGKPYINVTGLDVKLRKKCEDEKLIHVSTEYQSTQEATRKNGMRSSGWGIVKLFDRMGFERALAAAGKNGRITKEIIDAFRDLYLHVFRMRGFASPETLKMGSMQVKDNIEHMAERRATNRAKREATGTGLMSLEELPIPGNFEYADNEDAQATLDRMLKKDRRQRSWGNYSSRSSRKWMPLVLLIFSKQHGKTYKATGN